MILFFSRWEVTQDFPASFVITVTYLTKIFLGACQFLSDRASLHKKNSLQIYSVVRNCVCNCSLVLSNHYLHNVSTKIKIKFFSRLFPNSDGSWIRGHNAAWSAGSVLARREMVTGPTRLSGCRWFQPRHDRHDLVDSGADSGPCRRRSLTIPQII